MIASTQHDRFAALNYARLQKYGIQTVREGIHWHRIETLPGHYRFRETIDIARAAEKTGTR